MTNKTTNATDEQIAVVEFERDQLRTSMYYRPRALPPDERWGELASALTAVLEELKALRERERITRVGLANIRLEIEADRNERI